MKRKVLVIIMLGITLILLMVQGVIRCSTYNESSIFKDKEQIIIYQPEDMSNHEFVQELLNYAEQSGADLMYEKFDEEMNRVLYKTNVNEDFFHLYLDSGTIFVGENEEFSTKKDDNCKRIYGVVVQSEDIIIKNFVNISNLDLSSGKYWVQSNKTYELCDWLSEKNIEYDSLGGVYIGNDGDVNKKLILTFCFFMVITIAMYVFSKMKDYAIRKTFGYSKIDIWWSEIKEMSLSFVIEALIIGVVFFAILSFFYQPQTGVMWLCMTWSSIVKLYAIYILIIIIAVGYTGMRSNVIHVNGKREDILWFFLLTMVRLIVFAVCTILLSVFLVNVPRIYSMYQTTIDMRKKIKDYATVVETISYENPETNYEAYDDAFCRFYTFLHEKKHAIVADTHDASMGYNDDTNPMITINDLYLDFNESIYNLHGDRITSESLKRGMYNVLVPKGVDYNPEESGLCRATGLLPEQVNIIEYRDDSLFYSFSNENHPETGGYFQNPIAEVFDETMISDPSYRACCLETIFINGLFFKADSPKTAYEEIQPVIKQCGLNKLIMEAPSVETKLDDNLKWWIEDLAQNVNALLLFLIAWFVLLIYSVLLYYNKNAKVIWTKIMQGYTFLEIVWPRLVVECIVLFLVGVGINFYESVPVLLVISWLVIEIVFFFFMVRKICLKNLVNVSKGDL